MCLLAEGANWLDGRGLRRSRLHDPAWQGTGARCGGRGQLLKTYPP